MSDTSEDRRLVESILNQADGVFLWADLVTNEMLMADGDGETLSQKMERLKKTPNGLDDLYTQIFYKLSGKEHIDTSRIFKRVLHASRRLSSLELCFALQPNHYLRFMESLRTIHRQGCPDEPIYPQPFARPTRDSKCRRPKFCLFLTVVRHHPVYPSDSAGIPITERA